jgi:hypothetical protein
LTVGVIGILRLDLAPQPPDRRRGVLHLDLHCQEIRVILRPSGCLRGRGGVRRCRGGQSGGSIRTTLEPISDVPA